MARANKPEDTVIVAKLPPRKPKGGIAVKVGKPRKIMTAALRRTAAPQTGGTTTGAGGNFYSPELSTDFLELPQSRDEQRSYYRHFYDYDPFVGQAIDQHEELPLSKLRLNKPRAKNKELADKSMRFCEKWAKRIKLLDRLISIVHEYFLLGEAWIYCEDTSPDLPNEVRCKMYREITEDGGLIERWEEFADADEREIEWLKKNYKGWTAVRCLPPEQIHMESFGFTDAKIIELVPDAKTRALINRADQGDVQAQRVAATISPEISEAIREGRNIPLNTDPDAGSFVHYVARKKSDYEENGKSLLQRCLHMLVFRDKVRQALTSIASRHMTPYRLVYAEDMNEEQTEELREQVDMALMDPDYSIITNFQVNWEEIGADQRLPDWSWVWEFTDRQMYAGLGVTESLLSGESSYSGDRINLEVINTRYMLLREMLQDLVEEHFFKPMCKRMGFIEEDEDGDMIVITPRLSFTRLALRDSSDTFDQLYNLYTKGSLSIDTIYDVLNLDVDTETEKIQKEMLTAKDSTFNEALRGALSSAGNTVAEQSNLVEKLCEVMGLEYKPPAEEEGGRFG